MTFSTNTGKNTTVFFFKNYIFLKYLCESELWTHDLVPTKSHKQ